MADGNANAYEYESDDVIEQEASKKEEKKDEKVEDKIPEHTDEEEESGLSEIEQQAYAQGWREKDEWKGDPNKWVGAQEFLFRGELMERIQKQSKVINDMKADYASVQEALKALGEHNQKLAEKEYQRALKTLKRQRVDAVKDEDYDTVSDIEDQMDELKEAQQELKKPKEETKKEEKADEAPIPPVVEEWLNKNSNWYENDRLMRGAADTVAMDYLDKHPNDWDGALQEVDTTMRKRFPEEFGLSRTKRGAVTETDGRANSSKKSEKSSKKYTYRDLTQEQYSVAKTFVDQGVFQTMQEYVDQLAETGELDAQQ